MSVFYNNKTKKWGFRVYLFDREQGRKRQFTRTIYNTKAEATHQEALFIANHEKEQTKDVSFQEAFKDYTEYLNRLLKQTSIVSYNYIHKKYILSELKEIDNIKNIDYFKVNKIYKRVENSELSVSYKNKVLGTLIRMLKYFRDIYKLDLSYLKRLPRFRDDQPQEEQKKHYSIDEFKVFISNVANIEEEAIFKLLFYTGIRIGELRGLKWGDVDLENKTLTISRTINSKLNIGTYKEFTTKTTAGYRTIFLYADVIDVLERLKRYYKLDMYKDIDKYYVIRIDKPISNTTVRRYCNRIIEASGLHHITLHGFRHSYITFMITELNIDPYILKDQVGHKDISTTLNIYTHMNKNKQKEALEKAFKRLNNR